MPNRKPSPASDLEELHDKVGLRMASASQRYTENRRQIVEALSAADEPLDVPTLLKTLADVPQSSAYRSLSVFTGLGIVHRISGRNDSGYFELSEEFRGTHHHHALCRQCGRVVDIQSSPKFERALQEAARVAGEESGFRFDAHRIDLVGTCSTCS